MDYFFLKEKYRFMVDLSDANETRMLNFCFDPLIGIHSMPYKRCCTTFIKFKF